MFERHRVQRIIFFPEALVVRFARFAFGAPYGVQRCMRAAALTYALSTIFRLYLHCIFDQEACISLL